jgi:ABC-type transport system substrate-binding protein
LTAQWRYAVFFWRLKNTKVGILMSRLLISLPVAASLVAAFAPAVYASTLNVQLSADIRSSQPGVNRDAITDSVMLNVVEGLVAADEGGVIKPMLASDWTVSDDGTVYTFSLRDDVVFHNGAPMTAEEVKWTWDTSLSTPEHSCTTFFDGSRGSAIESVEILDPLTVEFTLSEPNALFLTYMAQSQCASNGIRPQGCSSRRREADRRTRQCVGGCCPSFGQSARPALSAAQ